MNLLKLNVEATHLIGLDDGETYYLSENLINPSESNIVSDEQLADFDFVCDFKQELEFEKDGVFKIVGTLNGEPETLEFMAYSIKLITG